MNQYRKISFLAIFILLTMVLFNAQPTSLEAASVEPADIPQLPLPVEETSMLYTETTVTGVESHAVVTDIPTTANLSALAAFAPNADVNLSISKSVSTGTDHPGAFISYTLNYANNGANTATGVIVTDTVPSEMVVWSVNASPPITDTGALPAYVWQLPDLAPGATGSITIEGVVAVTGGTFTNNAIISSADNDTNTADNSSSALFSLAESTTFAKTFGGSQDEFGHDVQLTSDGGYIIAGRTRSYGAGGDDAWVIKFDSDDNVEWQKTYGGSGDEVARSIQQTPDDGYIFTGRTSSYGAGSTDLWVVKLYSNGTIDWQKTYGGNSSEDGTSIQSNVYGNTYVVTGYTGSYGGTVDILALQLNGDGSVRKTLIMGAEVGGDYGYNIQFTVDGYILAGLTTDPVSLSLDPVLIELDAGFNIVRQRTYHDGTDYKNMSHIEQTSDGGYIAAGRNNNGTDDTDIWVVKLTSGLYNDWNFTYDSGASNDTPTSIQETSDGGYVISGYTRFVDNNITQAWVLKLHNSRYGWTAWQKTFGGVSYNSQASSVQQTSDGGYIVAGFTEGHGAGGYDIWVLKLDSNGSLNNAGCAAVEQDTNAQPKSDGLNYSSVADINISLPTVSGNFSTASMANSSFAPALSCGALEWNLNKTADNLTPNAGERITYTLTLSNTGTAAITEAAVLDTLPAGQTLAGPITLFPANAGVVGDAGTLPALAHSLTISTGQSVTFTLPVTVTVGGVQENIATAFAAGATAAEESSQSITVNGFPTGGDNTVSMDEDGSHTFVSGEFLYNDPEADGMEGVKITALPAAGSLTCNGLPVVVGDDCTVSAGVQNLRFTPAPDENGSPYAAFTFRVKAAAGAPYSAAAYTMTFNVTSISDSPLGADDTITATENISYTFQTADFTFNDGDNDSFDGIQLISVESAGDLEYAGADVVASQTYTDVTQLVFMSAQGEFGSPYTVFNFKLVDSSGAFSSAVYQMTINVTDVIARPTGADDVVTGAEDTSYTFQTNDFTFADGDNDTFAGIEIASLETVGDLAYGGTAVTIGSAYSDVTQLEFANLLNGNGSPYASFGFHILDSGGMSSTASYTMTINITPVNDSPTGGDAAVAATEDVPYTFSVGNFPYDDPVEGDAFGGIRITSIESAGGLECNETAVSVGTECTDIGQLVFASALNANGNSYATFQFRTRDVGGAVSTAIYTMTINVAPVADPPVGSDGSITSVEDTAYSFTPSDFPISDPDDDSLYALQITALETAGNLTYGGQPVTLNGVYTDTTALRFAPLLDEIGSPYSNFQFKIIDTTGVTSTASNVMAINVTAVDDPPTSGNTAVNGTEDVLYTFSNGDIPYSDPDGHTFDLLIITSVQTAGELECNGTAVTLLTTCAPVDLTYAAPMDEYGSPHATFGFKVRDSSGQESIAYTMGINLASAPDAPLGGDGLVTIPQSNPYTFTLSDFAYYDGDGDTLSGLNLTALPLAGTLTHNGLPVSTGLYADVTLFTFTPDPGDTGAPYADFTFQLQDSSGALSLLSYNMSINVQGGNPPTGGNGTVTAIEDIQYAFTLTDFVYSDPDGDPLTGIWFVGAETSGDLQCNNAEILVGSVCDDIFSLTFDPDPNAFGTPYASFDFRLRDASGFLSEDTYTMGIDVSAVNDVPVLYSSPVMTATEDIPYIYNIVGADNDIAASLTITTISNFNLPSWLILTDNGDGTGTLAGTPRNNDVGMYSMDLALFDDAGASDNQPFFLTVINTNDAPLFTSTASIAATEDIFYAYEITVVDVDAYDPVTITVAAPLPAWLTIGDRGDGTATLTGTPHNAEVGDYNISLQVSDFAGAVGLQNFTLTVVNVNEAPVFATVPVGAAAQGQAYQYAMAAVDNDLNELLAFTLLNGPAWLSVNDYGDGSADLNGTPTFSDVGTYPITLQVEDRDGLSVTQIYTMTVLNTPPTAVDDYASTPINAPVILDLRANDSDLDGNSIAVIAAATPATGTVTLLNAAQARYTPPVGFTGEVVFTYTVSDGADNSIGYAFVDVFSSPPVGVDDTGETVAGYPVTVDVLNNDFDPDGEPLLITAVDPMISNGSILIAADGQSLTYLPPAAFVGDAVFGYTLQVDGDAGQWETAVVTVTVRDISSINADLSITRSSTPLTFPEGEARDISSDIYVTNNNLTEIAAGVVITDMINVPVLSGSATSGLGSCLLSNSGAICDLGVIPPGQTVLVHLNYAIGTAPGLMITSTVDSQSTDPILGNNITNTTFTVQAGRSTRTAGPTTLTADSFVFVPSTGNTRGIGNILIGDHFKLSNPADAVEFNTSDITTITGTLTYVVGDQNIVRGLFGVDSIGNIEFTQVDEVFIDDLGGFTVGTPSLTTLNLLNGEVTGLANLNFPTPPGELYLSGSASIVFNLLPGPYANGQTSPFTISYFNASGDMLEVVDITATLIRQADEHYLIGSGAMNLNLPGNNLNRDIPYLALMSDGNFTSALNPFSLSIQGTGAFKFVQPELDNSGLHDRSRSLLTGSNVFFYDTSVTDSGFNQAGKAFSMPSITSDIYSISHIQARIAETASGYTLEPLGGDLRLRLPQNNFTILGFDVTANAHNADIILNVGEAKLTLRDPYLDGDDIVARSITWKLPSDMGGGIETFNQSVRLTSNDLSSIPFPNQVKVGRTNGVDADVTSVDIQQSNGSYQMDLGILMHVDLPGIPPEGVPGTLEAGTIGVSANLEPFTFIVAGYEIVAGGAAFDMEQVRLQIEEAEMIYAEENPEQTIGLILELIGVDGNTVQFGNGSASFRLPDICLGVSEKNEDGEDECKGGAAIKELQAELVQNSDGTYDIAAEGEMEWPGDEPTPLPFGCSGIEAAISVSYDPNTGRQVFTMIPNAPGGVVNMTDVQGNSITLPFTESSLSRPTYINGQRVPDKRLPSAWSDGVPIGPSGMLLTGAYFALNGCEIPLIDTTGPVFVSQLGGGFEFDDGGVILRLTLGVDVKTKGQEPAPFTINTDSYIFLPKRWVEFSGGCLSGATVDPWEAEQELDENSGTTDVELESGNCIGTYRFTGLGTGDIGTLVAGTGTSNAPAIVTITSRFDKHPWFVRSDGEFIYNEETTFATGFLEIDPRGVRMELISSDEVAEHFELEFVGGVSAWVDASDEFWLTGFLEASFRITMEMLWDVLPDSGMDFVARIEFGHFLIGGEDKILGFKGMATGSVVIIPEVCVPIAGCTSEVSQNFNIGFFIDQDFNIATGDAINNYQLATRSRVQRAYTAVLLSESRMVSDAAMTALYLNPDSDLTFIYATDAGKKGGEYVVNGRAFAGRAPLAELLVDVAVPYETTTRVTLQSQAGGPTMTLEGPDATIYGHDKLPAGVTYTEYMTFTTPLGKTAVADQGLGQLRVSHAVADYGTMDVLVGGVPLFTGLTFTETAVYQTFAPGAYIVSFVAAGTTSPILAQATVNLAAGQDATVIAVGQTGSIQAWAVEDDNSPRPGGRPYVRLLHAGSGLNPVDFVQRMGREYYIDIGYRGIGDYIKMYPMGYTFDVRSNSDQTLLTTLSNVHLEDGGIYTIFLFDGVDGTVGTLVQDAAAPAQLQIMHIADNEGVLEISVDGMPITNSLNLGTGTIPVVLEVGSHQLLISDGGTTVISETILLETAVPYAYVIESSSGTTVGQLISNEKLASYGFVNARMLHLAPTVPDVDVTISYGLGNETPLFSGVGFEEMSGQFNVQERITATIVMRLAGTPQVLYTFNDVPMPMGDVLTLYLYEQSGVPQLATAVDASMAVKTTAMYSLEPATAGNWTVHLHGDVINGNDYKLLVDGDKPAPIFEDVEIIDVAGQPTLQWRMTAPLPETTVGLSYKAGSITETEVISQDGKIIINTVAVYSGHTFTGTLSAPSDPGWTSGALQQYPIDLSVLENGTYSIYLTADDLDGSVTRAAALDPLVVSHTWPTTWNAGLVIANEGYREIRADWTRFPSPEVEQYTLIGTSASGLQQKAVVSGNGFTPYQFLNNLTPGETYTFTVQAWDGQSFGRVTASDPVLFTVPGATFAVTGESGFAVGVGQNITTVITVSTTIDPYPALVGLSAGGHSDGLSISFSQDIITPTLAGTAVEVYLSTSSYLPGGMYTATVDAHGGGEAVLFDLQPDIIAPSFDLTATPGVPMTIQEDGALAMTIGAARYDGHTDEIWFTVQDLPLVDWMVDTTILSDTVEATLTMTDTTLLQHGTYTFTLYAEDGRSTSAITRTLIVDKPTYSLSASTEKVSIATSITQTVQVPITLTVSTQGIWNDPVTLMLDPKMAPPFGEAGFTVEMESFVEISAPDEVILWVSVSSQTPSGTYLLPVIAESDGEQERVNLFVEIVVGNIAPIAIGDVYTATEDVVLSEPSPGVLWNDTDVERNELTAIINTGVTDGLLALASDGSFVYTPTADFCGTDSFTYQANDGSLSSNTMTAVINVTCVNDAPIAYDDVYSTTEDIPLVIAATGVISNDIDIDSSLSVTVDSSPSNGAVNLNLDGSFIYTPALNFNGEDVFSYIVSDGKLTDTAVVTITVTAVNDAPIANNDVYTVEEDTPLVISATGVISNDIDVDSSLSVTINSSPSNGAVNLNLDGSFTYTPTLNFNGEDVFSYIVSDGVLTDTGVVTITVAPINNAPIATNDAYTTAEDVTLVISATGVISNDIDIDSSLSVTVDSSPSNGAVNLNLDGSFAYTPALNFNGEDVFSYIVSDGDLTDTAVVTITVTAVNDAPIANNDVYTVEEDTPLVISATGVISNDIDVDSSLTVIIDNTPSNGVAVLKLDGSFTYTPTLNFNGEDGFTYIVSDGVLTDTGAAMITVTAVNDAPIANNDVYVTEEDTPLVIGSTGVISNDIDVDNSLSVTVDSSPSNGGLNLNLDGSFIYTPALNFNGEDVFSYIVSDGKLTDTAIVTITVTAVNDAPIANNDAYTVEEDTPLVISATGVISNDIDVDSSLTVIIDNTPSNGVAVLNLDGSFVYTPTLNFNGEDGFTYIVSDGVLTDTGAAMITVTAVNDAPIATNDAYITAEDVTLIISATGVISNDIDVDNALSVTVDSSPSNGAVNLNLDGSFAYTPTLNFNGEDGFTYIVNDGVLTDMGVVTITVTAVNDAPIATNDAYTTEEDVTLIISATGVISNDIDVDSSLTVIIDNTPSNGVAVLNLDGSFAYTPTLNFNGEDGFTYIVSDGVLTDTGVVTITVTAVNDTPIANNDAYTTEEDVTLIISATGVISNDIDVDNALSVTVDSSPSNGVLNLNLDGSFAYTPTLNFNGEDGFTYIVNDGVLTDTGVVTITVTAVNDAPDAIAEAAAAAIPGQIAVLDGSESSDTDGDSLTYSWIQTGGVSVTLSSSNAISPTFVAPVADGVLTFSLTVTDSGGLSDSDIVTMTVNFHTIFLPVVVNNYSSQPQPQPDIIVEDVIITSDSLEVIIRNDGNAQLSGSFWVDMYINPDTPPTGVNQTWETNGGEGIVWGVTELILAPGESTTLLLSNPSYDAGASKFSGTIAAGSTVYVQADSAGSSFGNVHELDESNNISDPLVTTVPSTPLTVLPAAIFLRTH